MAEPALYEMLELLNRYGISDACLEKRYNLNRKTIWRIRDGEALPRKHNEYFTGLLKVINNLRKTYHLKKDTERHREIRDFLFDIMLHEFGVK